MPAIRQVFNYQFWQFRRFWQFSALAFPITRDFGGSGDPGPASGSLEWDHAMPAVRQVFNYQFWQFRRFWQFLALAFPITSDSSDPASHGEPASGSLEWDHGDAGGPPGFQLPILAISAILAILGVGCKQIRRDYLIPEE